MLLDYLRSIYRIRISMMEEPMFILESNTGLTTSIKTYMKSKYHKIWERWPLQFWYLLLFVASWCEFAFEQSLVYKNVVPFLRLKGGSLVRHGYPLLWDETKTTQMGCNVPGRNWWHYENRTYGVNDTETILHLLDEINFRNYIKDIHRDFNLDGVQLHCPEHV